MPLIDACLPPIRTIYRTPILGVSEPLPPPPPALPPPPREFRRVIGYHNAIVEDATDDSAPLDPPTYEIAIFRPPRPRLDFAPRYPEGHEPLPDYTCSVATEGPIAMKLEQANPFDVVERSPWGEVYAILTGTVFKVYALRKSNGSGLKSSKPIPAPGRLFKSYTLQHAEIGMAADHPKYEMVAKSVFVQRLPETAIARLQESEPHLFEPVRRHVIRLRLETEQFLIRCASSEDRGRWLDKLCAAVDIAPPIDERSEPKYHTLPRRRRRNPNLRALAMALAASLADQGPQDTQGQERTSTSQEAGEEQDNTLMASTTADPDSGDIDTGLAMTDLAEPSPDDRSGHIANLLRIFPRHSNERRSVERQSACTMQPQEMTALPSYAPAPSGLTETLNEVTYTVTSTRVPARIYPDAYTKWQPQFLIDTAQQIRYKRHCLPNLLYQSKRANDIVIKDGKRWRIDWDRDELRPWPEAPPQYERGGSFEADLVWTPEAMDLGESDEAQDRSSMHRPTEEEDPVLQRVRSAGTGRPSTSTQRSMPINSAPLTRVATAELDPSSPTADTRPISWTHKVAQLRSSIYRQSGIIPTAAGPGTPQQDPASPPPLSPSGATHDSDSSIENDASVRTTASSWSKRIKNMRAKHNAQFFSSFSLNCMDDRGSSSGDEGEGEGEEAEVGGKMGRGVEEEERGRVGVGLREVS